VALPHGSTYGDWAGAWWNWISAEPFETNVGADETGELCGVNQTGKVWFIGGRFYPQVTRQCEIPAGQTVFYFLRGIFWWPPDCSTPEECKAWAKEFGDSATTLEIEVDGVSERNISQYRSTAHFLTEVKEGTIWNQFGYAPGLYDTYGDFTAVMLAPLSVGQHTVHGIACYTGYGCEEHTYNLTVLPGQ